MATHVQPKGKSDPARSRRAILSVARTLVLGLGKQAHGAMMWCINVDAKDERDILGARSHRATRDLVREAMINCCKLDRRE